MWKIEISDRNDSLKSLRFHSTFTSLNKIITYTISPEDNSYPPVKINFVTKKDKKKKNFLIEKSELENRELTVTYSNPSNGSSGLSEPMIILENDMFFFKVIFMTNFLADSDTYLLTIEFFIQNK